jgi:hypothetical protein
VILESLHPELPVREIPKIYDPFQEFMDLDTKDPKEKGGRSLIPLSPFHNFGTRVFERPGVGRHVVLTHDIAKARRHSEE